MDNKKKEKVWKNIVITFSSDTVATDYWIAELTGADGRKHYEVREEVTSKAPSKSSIRLRSSSSSRN